MSLNNLLIIPITFILLFFACSSHIKTTDYPWYQFYSYNQLDSAEIALKKYLNRHPREITSLCYYAETLKRLKKLITADSISDIVLNMEPCNSFALRIKGDVSNSQYYSKSPLKNERSTQYYYLRAVECDSTYGDAWEVIWIKSMKNGDNYREKLALTRLYQTGYYTKYALSIARWYLSDLPKNAVLITNGDMDTYPLLVIQINENFRPDIAIVNASMLNMKWYFEFLCHRYNIPIGFSADEYKNLKHKRRDDGTISTISQQILKKWYDLFENKKFFRPYCFVITINKSYLQLFNKRLELYGPFYQFSADTVKRKGDPIALFNSLQKINPNDFTGPLIGEKVTSPVLLKDKNSRRFDANVVAMAMHAAIEFSKDSKDSSAYEVLDWIDEYLEVVDGKQKYRDLTSGCRKQVMNGKYRN